MADEDEFRFVDEEDAGDGGEADQGAALEGLTVEERIDALASEPLLSTGKLASPEAVEKAKQIARESVARAEPLDLPPAVPYSEPDEETPPDETAPTFLVTPNFYGPGTMRIQLSDGTPLGNWLDQPERHDLTGPQVETLLRRMGLEAVAPGKAEWFGEQRQQRLTADRELGANPAVAAMMRYDAGREARMAPIRAAFEKSLAEKEKKKR